MNVSSYDSMLESDKQKLLAYLSGSQSSIDVKSKLSKLANIPETEIDDALAMRLYSQLAGGGQSSGLGMPSPIGQQSPILTAQQPQGALSQYTDPITKTVKANMSGSTGDNIFGQGGKLGGGWLPAAGGALSGFMEGKKFYDENPEIMQEGKDGFGENYKDFRTMLGGAALGGTMGYFGGPIGAALAGPATKAVNPLAEKFSRGMVNFGDSWGGAAGAFSMDPAATIASGKYSFGDYLKPPIISKWFGW